MIELKVLLNVPFSMTAYWSFLDGRDIPLKQPEVNWQLVVIGSCHAVQK